MEMLIAMTILSFGLLSIGQMMFVAMGSASLARSKGSAAIVAQNRLEFLADLYRRDEAHADLTVGTHGPIQVQLNNANGTAQNRFNVSWTVSTVSDPRGLTLKARQVLVTVTPIGTGTTANTKAFMNKVLNVSSIFSPRF